MTAATLRELGMNAFCVRQVVTITTGWHGFMLGGVTGNTGHIMVLGLARHQLVVSSLVAGGTMDVRGAVGILKDQRHVDIVTDEAVLLGLSRSMGFVAFSTFRDVAVSVGVTQVAGDIGVLARVGHQFFVLLGVTGQALSLQVAFEDNT